MLENDFLVPTTMLENDDIEVLMRSYSIGTLKKHYY